MKINNTGWFPRQPARANDDPLPEDRKAKIKELEQKAAQGRADRLKSPNNRDTTPTDPTPTAPVTEPKKPEAVVPKAVEPATVSDDDDDDVFDDFLDDDAPTKKVDDVVKPDDTVDDDLDAEPTGNDQIAVWRARVKEQGAERKRAETRAIELEAERDALRDQLKAESEKIKALSSQNVDWNSHESVKPLWDEFDNSVYQAAIHIDDDETRNKFVSDAQGPLLSEYFNASKGAKTTVERLKVDATFKRTLEDRYGVDNGTGAVASLKKALETYLQIEDKTTELKGQYANNRLSLGTTEYQSVINEFKPIIDELGNVDDDFIDTNPDRVESVIGSRYKTDEEFRKNADKFKRRATEFIFGLRPLNQDEMDRVEKIAKSDGITLDQYMKRREDNYKTARAKFFNDVFYNQMAMSDYDEMRRVYARYVKSKQTKTATSKVVSKSKPVENVLATTQNFDNRKRSVMPGGVPENYVPASQRVRERKNS